MTGVLVGYVSVMFVMPFGLIILREKMRKGGVR